MNLKHLEIWYKCNNNINFSGIGLLASFLSFEARKRISAREAMRNPYFENLGSGVALLKDSKYTLGLNTFFHLCPKIGLWWSSQIFRWCLHSRFPRLVWSQSTFSALSFSVRTLPPRGSLIRSHLKRFHIPIIAMPYICYVDLGNTINHSNLLFIADDSLFSCPGVHLTKDPGYRSYPSR